MSVVNLDNILSVEFGVCLSNSNGEECVLVPVDTTVQNAIKEMVDNTVSHIGCFPNPGNIPVFEASEKYSSMESLRYPIQDEDVDMMPVQLFTAENLTTEQDGLADPKAISFYFAVLRNRQNHKLIAIRRAIQFKGVLKAKGRLIHWIDDTMKIVEDNVFKLDEDFDYLVTDDEIFILRPNNFVYTADLTTRVMERATENTQALQQMMPFIEFANLTEYASTHSRAARLVAAIRSRDDWDRVTKDSLRTMCDETGIELEEVDGKLYPSNGQEMHFLYLLDRRRYTSKLISNNPETYEAASRRQV